MLPTLRQDGALYAALAASCLWSQLEDLETAGERQSLRLARRESGRAGAWTAVYSGAEPASRSDTISTSCDEAALVKAFIPARRQERFLEIIAKPKKKANLLAELSHFKALNPKFMVARHSNQVNPFAITKLLRAKGAGATCCVMSENSDLDGREMDLETALNETVGAQMGTLISCIPGRLGYFEGEDGRCILERLR